MANKMDWSKLPVVGAAFASKEVGSQDRTLGSLPVGKKFANRHVTDSCHEGENITMGREKNRKSHAPGQVEVHKHHRTSDKSHARKKSHNRHHSSMKSSDDDKQLSRRIFSGKSHHSNEKHKRRKIPEISSIKEKSKSKDLSSKRSDDEERAITKYRTPEMTSHELMTTSRESRSVSPAPSGFTKSKYSIPYGSTSCEWESSISQCKVPNHDAVLDKLTLRSSQL